jgi:dTDP-4-dehydrorhamnose reductase
MDAMRVLVTGSGGILGRALQVELPHRGLAVTALTRAELDITDTAAVRAALDRYAPDVVINCAAYTRVDDAESHEAEAAAVNTDAARALAEDCSVRAIRIAYPSTDYVFAGDRLTAYAPDDSPAPLNAYGRTKLGGESGTRAVPDHLIVRTSWLFGRGGANFVRTIAARLEMAETIRVVNDQTGRPTYARHLARGIAELLRISAPAGTYHVANAGQATWFEVAQELAAHSGRAAAVTPCTTSEFPRPARRPAWSVLDTTKTDKLIGALPSWRGALAEAWASGDY